MKIGVIWDFHFHTQHKRYINEIISFHIFIKLNFTNFISDIALCPSGSWIIFSHFPSIILCFNKILYPPYLTPLLFKVQFHMNSILLADLIFQNRSRICIFQISISFLPLLLFFLSTHAIVSYLSASSVKETIFYGGFAHK